MDRYTPTVLIVPYVRISRFESFSSLCPSYFFIFSKEVCEKRKVLYPVAVNCLLLVVP